MRKVLFIAGCWRSGSTLLGDVLGSLEGFIHVGELHHVWSRGLTLNWLCGCGEPFRECGFWSQVMTRWMGGTAASDLERTRRRMLEEMTGVESASAVCHRRPEYLGEIRELIERLFEVSGAQVIIDSSKSFRQACILLATGVVELNVVHLVRDPRAVVFSLVHRPKMRLDDPGGPAMLGLDAGRAVGLWLHSNRQAGRLADAPGCRYLFVRYEDFVNSPQAMVTQIVQFTGQSSARIGDVGTVEIPTSHTISGNPDRLRRGIRIRRNPGVDAIEPSLRELVEVRTTELLSEYGYSPKRVGLS